MELTNIELTNINGGGYGFFIGLGMLFTMIVGIVDGYLRPLKCN